MLGLFSARGGPTGGDGGFVEVSGLGAVSFPNMLTQVDVSAPAGRAGTLLIDPAVIIVDVSGVAVGGNVTAPSTPPGTLTLTAASISAFNGDLLLEATNRITVNASNLPGTDNRITKNNGDLTLRVTAAANAGDGIFINSDVRITGNNETLTLTANGAQGVITTTANIEGRSGVTVTNATVLTLGGTVTSDNNSAISLTAGRIVSQAGATIQVNGSNNGNAVTIVANGAAGAGGIALGAGVTAGPNGTVTLQAASNASITQTAGAITAGTLRAEGVGGAGAAAGSIDLSLAGNSIETLAAARANGAVSVRSDILSFTVQSAVGNGVTLTNGQGAAGMLVTGAVTGGAGGVTLTADRMLASAPVTGANIRILQQTSNLGDPRRRRCRRRSGRGRAVPFDDHPRQPVDDGRHRNAAHRHVGNDRHGADLRSGRLPRCRPWRFTNPRIGVLDLRGELVNQAVGSSLNVGTVTVTAGVNGVALDRAANAISGLGAITSGQNVSVVTAAPALTVSGAVTAANGGTIALEAPRLLTQSGGTLGFDGAGNGAVTLRATGSGAAGGMSLGAGVASGTGSVTLLAASDAAIAQGAATLSAATVTARGLGGAGTSAGSVALGGTSNAIVTVADARATGAVSVRSNVSTFTVQSAVGDGVSLTNGQAGGILAVAGAVTGGTGGVTLTADRMTHRRPGVRRPGDAAAADGIAADPRRGRRPCR